MFIRDAGVSISVRIGHYRVCVGERRAIHGSGEEPISSNAHQLSLLLSKCSSDKSLSDGRLLHCLATQHCFDAIPWFANRLLRMYAHCGSLYDARSLFNEMHSKDPHSWRYLIKAHASYVNDSLQIFQQMMMEGFLPINATLMSVLAAVVGTSSLVYGMHIHACIAGSEFFSDVDVGNSVIGMYNKCDNLRFALEFFADMPSYNVVSFNTLITALVQHGKSEETLRLFHQMELQAVSPSSVSFISIVSACAATTRLRDGKEMHALSMCSDFVSDVTLGNAFLNMYGKCGSLTDAERLFWTMPRREVITWNCMITAYILQKRYEDSLQLFQHMETMGPLPNNTTFTNILSACACKTALAEVKRLHLRAVGDNSETDVVLGTALVNMYSKCGGLEEAVQVFENMSCWDSVLWNAMIEAYVKVGKSREAIQLFEEMQLKKGLIPTKVTFIVLLDAFTTLEEGKYIHAMVLRHGFGADPVVGTGLMNLYSRCCSMEDVHEVFDNMPQHDLVSWNALLAAMSRHGLISNALCGLQMMIFEGVIPNCISFINLCDACNSSAASKEALWIHALIVASELDKDVYVVKSVIAMYGKIGKLELAWKVFEEIDEHDEIICNAMIAAYSQIGRPNQALSVYRQMQIEGIFPGRFTLIDLVFGFINAETVSEGRRVHATIIGSLFEEDVTVTNTFLNMYGKSGTMEEANMLFAKAHKQDNYTWSVILAAYAQRNKGREAILIFQRMLLECMLPDKVLFISMISACATQALIAEGKQMHACVLENDFRSDVNLMNALINMYGKCGSVKDAFNVFDNMCTCNVISWNALMTVHAFHGRGKEVLQLYQRMRHDNAVPDNITYSIVLSACSHSGLLKEGLECFISMGQDCGVKPTEEHVHCIIDLLCRAGLLDEGENIIKSLVSQPTAVAWTMLLGFCKMHYDGDRGQRVARSALHLEPQNSSLYVLLSNIYASSATSKEKMTDEATDLNVNQSVYKG